jgi:chemotaxis protein methyltransferase CheR
MRAAHGQTAGAGLEIARAQAWSMTFVPRTLEAANVLAHAIVNTLPEPFLVLDAQLRVVEASRAFYETFQVDPEHTQGCLLYALGDGQWDIPALRTLLETIIPDKVAMDGFEVEHDFPGIGRKTMLLNARKVLYADSDDITILLAFHDVTIRRAIEREKEEILREANELLKQKQVLLEEMRHRVANSLQIIASILLLKARAVSSDEIRFHLKDAHQRVMSVAAVQQHLHATDGIDRINVGSYFRKLCTGLADSMVGEAQPVVIDVKADDGIVLSAEAVSLGLIVTELVINALKYAFPAHKADAVIRLAYEIDGRNWRLTVSDNGVGAAVAAPSKADSGLGTTIIKALAKQLDAKVDTNSTPAGMSVSITRATFTSRTPTEAIAA